MAPNPDNPAENATKFQVLAGTVLGNNLGLVARAEKVASIADLGGKSVIVDNPNSGFALAARRILANYNLTLAGGSSIAVAAGWVRDGCMMQWTRTLRVGRSLLLLLAA